VKWEKRGLIYGPDGSSSWARHSALQPTPLLRSDGVIRIFVGLRDDQGIARVGFVDVDADDPSRVIAVSRRPSLDVGSPGCFDDNGVVPCAVVERDGAVFLYYAGYQLTPKVKFLAFGGLAISEDGGSTFVRHSQVPVTDRSDEGIFFRVTHSILREGSRWRVWYGAGSEFQVEDGRQLPSYNIRYMESADGITFPPSGHVCLDTVGADEYRVGRPYVIVDADRYRMFYSACTRSSHFRLGYAESADGITWIRMDDAIGLDVSRSGWDSEMMAYPSVVRHGDKTHLFYNGNKYGRSGFGWASLTSW
jgi:hypothetical protein